MRKIKHKVNKLVDTYCFRKDILKNNTLYELCKYLIYLIYIWMFIL